MLNHIGRFGSPEVIHTDQGPTFHNELVQELLCLCAIEHSFATAYSSEENGIVKRANREVVRHLRALLFDSRVHDKWSFEQLPLVQRIMNTVEKTSTGVTPADLILSIVITEDDYYNKSEEFFTLLCLVVQSSQARQATKSIHMLT
jgi:hypothetical protein